MATKHTERRPGNINQRAKGKRTDSGLNPGSFAAYLSDAPKSASFTEIVEAYKDGVDPADLPSHLSEDDASNDSDQSEIERWNDE